MEAVTVSSLVGMLPTAALFYAIKLGPYFSPIMDKKLEVETISTQLDKHYSQENQYKSLKHEELLDQVEALYLFTSAMLENSKPLSPNYAKVINDNFWDLI